MFRQVGYPRRMVVREDFRPRFNLFRPFEAAYLVCAMPTLVQRVQQSRCLGVSFTAFGTPFGVPYWLSDEDGAQIRRPG